MTAYLTRQAARNSESRDGWNRFAPHRTRVMSLLKSAAHPSVRLGLLGAGNCNDVNLCELVEVYSAVELIDLDEDALGKAVARQGLAENDAIRCIGMDLTAGGGEAGRVDELMERTHPVPACPGKPFGVLASMCVLSQLIEWAAGLAKEDSRLPEILLAVRRQHLETMVSWLLPGGVGILITDFVSSDTCPELPTLAAEQLPVVAQQWLADRNFFSGINPVAVRGELARMSSIQAKSLELAKPWKWELGPRTYAVTALAFRKVG